VAAISQHQSSLALGNVLGSSISNILGAFSLGLIFSPVDTVFDRSAKIYTSLLLALTSAFVIFLAFFRGLGRIGGGLLVTTFIFYMVSIANCIYKGIVAPPEDDDDDDDSDSNSDSDSDSDDEDDKRGHSRSSTSTLRDEEAALHEVVGLVDNETGLKPASQSPSNIQIVHKPRKSLTYHIVQLVLGFLALSLSGYILSHSISSIADAYSLSGNLLGITILSFATTLPEKLVAVFGGARSQSGIVVANTAGSNVFLITLCAGVLFLAGDLEVLKGHLNAFEVVAVWASSALLWVIVMTGGRRWMGWGLLGLYVAFIAVEFIVFGRSDSD
jgi:Ca2+/Na+ antiporter